jgi:putative glutamine amidotransferase
MLFRLLITLACICVLPNVYAKTVTVGCATKCDFFFKLALKREAKTQNVSVRIVDVSKSGTTIDWKNYDAIILPGGADIDPKYYLPHVEPELQEYTKNLDHLVKYSAEGKRRDPIEYNLLKEYFAREDLANMPILGVCRGMQMLAVSQGIPLYVDIKTELGIKNRRYLWDRIYIDSQHSNSLMSQLFTQSFRAFKRHHQGIRIEYFNKYAHRWPDIALTAFSNKDLIAEAIEFRNRPVMGVQFHPENDFGFERNRIFGWLIKQALKRKSGNEQTKF